MKNLYLSDIHLGNPYFKYEEIIIQLIEQDYENIFIIGDLIDVWEDSIEHILEKHSRLISKLNLLKNLIIIRGNHDPEIVDLQNIFPEVNICDQYVSSENFILLHGYDFDKLITKYSWLAKSFYPIQWMFERFNIDLTYFFRNLFYSISMKRKKKYYNDLVLEIEKEIVLKYNQYDAVIIGHTHFPKIFNTKTVKYINCGDWTHSCTYVEYDLETKYFTLIGE